MWTGWPDASLKNITGSIGTAILSSVFDIVAASGASSITDDLLRKGIEIFFDSALFTSGALCENDIACHIHVPAFNPPAEPPAKPYIAFNSAYMIEDPAVLAAVLVHEGTHFQQYLDGSLHNEGLGKLTTIDIEFRAWWNEAVYWDSVRASFLPISTSLEDEEEKGWRPAKQGEGALRDYITPLYS